MTDRITVKTTCDKCGDVSTSIETILLRLLDDNTKKVGHYRFLCPKCNTIVVKNATEYVINILMSAEVKVEFYNLSMELLERPRDIDASPISADDAIDLHFQLEEHEEEWMDRMLKGE